MARRVGASQREFAAGVRQRIAAFIAEHHRLWLVRSRRGGLNHSCGFWQKVIEATEAGL